MLTGKMEIKTDEEIAGVVWEMTMNGGRGKVRDYLASHGIWLPPFYRITDIKIDFSKDGWYLVASKMI
jgi:hypothetical protein